MYLFPDSKQRCSQNCHGPHLSQLTTSFRRTVLQSFHLRCRTIPAMMSGINYLPAPLRAQDNETVSPPCKLQNDVLNVYPFNLKSSHSKKRFPCRVPSPPCAGSLPIRHGRFSHFLLCLIVAAAKTGQHTEDTDLTCLVVKLGRTRTQTSPSSTGALFLVREHFEY